MTINCIYENRNSLRIIGEIQVNCLAHLIHDDSLMNKVDICDDLFVTLQIHDAALHDLKLQV